MRKITESARAEQRARRDEMTGWVDENCPDWLEERCVEDWLASLSSDRTRRKAVEQFKLFVGFVEQCPGEIYEQRVLDLQSTDPKERSRYETQIVLFRNEAAKHHYSENSVRTFMNRAMSFFSHNYIKLRLPRGSFSVQVSEEARNARRPKQPPTNDEVRAIYAIADLEDRLLLHFLYQYGLATVDVSKLRVEIIPVTEATEPDFVYFEYWREKTDIPIMTALNPEVIEVYKAHMARRNWPDEGWVFETNRGNRRARAAYPSICTQSDTYTDVFR